MIKDSSIKSIRDLAISLEKKDILAAFKLMELAQESNQNGTFVEKKIKQYKNIIEINKIHKTGELAIIPVGFRCHTKMLLKRRYQISQPTLPFDNGFFPPESVVSILRNPRISLNFNDKSTFAICKKFERFEHPIYGRGIKFCPSSKAEIDNIISTKYESDIKKYRDQTKCFLDISGGYYTLDTKHNYVLAHYNWSKFSKRIKAEEFRDMEQYLELASEVLNRRIKRMMDICHSAKKILFVFHEYQKYKYMLIDEMRLGLENLSELKETANDIFKSKVYILPQLNINTSIFEEIFDN